MTASATPAATSNSLAKGLRLTGLSGAGVLLYLVVLWIALYLVEGIPLDAAFPVALQQTVNALSIGAIYALIALGYTMVYGIIELINFAHGDIFMLGAFLSVVFLGGIMGQGGSVVDVPMLVFLLVGALLFAMPIVGFINVAIERVVYRPLRNAPRLAPLITAIGMSLRHPECGAHRRRIGGPIVAPGVPARMADPVWRCVHLGPVDLHLRPGADADVRPPGVCESLAPGAGHAGDGPGS